MIDWCNQNQGFAMVLLTLAYVLATIAICIFNYRSAKATSEQTKELKRQFDEQNRAFLTVTMQKVKNDLITLCIENHGKKIAKNVSLNINESFLNIVQDDLAKRNLDNLLKSSFTVGIGQKWHTFVGVSCNINAITSEIMELTLLYEDDLNKYKEQTNIDFGQYNWVLLNDTEITDIRNSINKIAKVMEKK